MARCCNVSRDISWRPAVFLWCAAVSSGKFLSIQQSLENASELDDAGALKIQDMKMKDQVASHENAVRENAGMIHARAAATGKVRSPILDRRGTMSVTSFRSEDGRGTWALCRVDNGKRARSARVFV